MIFGLGIILDTHSRWDASANGGVAEARRRRGTCRSLAGRGRRLRVTTVTILESFGFLYFSMILKIFSVFFGFGTIPRGTHSARLAELPRPTAAVLRSGGAEALV